MVVVMDDGRGNLWRIYEGELGTPLYVRLGTGLDLF